VVSAKHVRRPLAALCFVAAGLFGADGAAVREASADDVEISDEARKHFKIGVNLLRDPDGARYEDAYRAFKSAYAASPSYKILGNLALCAMKLERDSEAIAAYTEYLSKAQDLDPGELRQIEADLSTLQSTVATLKLSVEPTGAAIVDTRTPVKGSPVTNRYGPLDGPLTIGIRAGQHRMVIQRRGYRQEVLELDADAGTTIERSIVLSAKSSDDLDPPPGIEVIPGPDGPTTTERPVPAGVWVGLAATGAFAIVAGVTGGLALSKGGEFDDANTGSEPGAADDIKSSGETLNLLTDVFIGGAVVAAAVTTVLYLTRPEVEAGDGVAMAQGWSSVRVGPTVAHDGGGVGLSARF